ncbi:T9SS type A sorting domain-containing protein [Candidatus Fermentibacterales bacterium]|nr:T9SS type A sorting domain-containing protein [Candidatus Fermentibacterales bacterium]
MRTRPHLLLCLSVVLCPAMSAGAHALEDLPDVFDLRDVGGECFVTSIKNQQGGTCWTHGAMAAIEGNLMMTGLWEENLEEGEPDLAEYHLDWWNGFNEFFNGDLDPPSGGGLTVHMGGDYMVTSAYLSRGDGAVRDIDGQSYDVPPDYTDDGFHYYFPRQIEWLTAGQDLENIEAMKLRLMEEGVIGTCMCFSSEFISPEFVHYQPPESPYDPNHAVAIIGWDDSLATHAPLPGAWLCKNSWGEGWGLDGFFWISYYDKWCGQHPQMGAVSFREVEPMRYDHVYYHDYHGWRDTLESVSTAMNAFEAAADHMIEAVGIVTCRDDVAYCVGLYGSFSGSVLSDPLCETSGTFECSGMHTVDLPEPVFVAEGDSIWVCVELGGGGMAYDRTSDVPVLLGAQYRTIVESTASPGESYYYSDGQWHDLYYWSGNPYPGTGSFCIKAMAVDYGLWADPEGPLESRGPAGGPFEPSGWTLTLENRGYADITYSVSVSPAVVWLSLGGQVAGTLPPYGSVTLAAEVNPNADSLGDGAYVTDLVILNTSEHIGDIMLPVLLLAGESSVFYQADMSEDPGWEYEGNWAWGEPLGLGGEHGHPDPAEGFSGEPVMGYDLAGDYENNMPPLCATTGALDCRGRHDVRLEFRRWLGVQESGFDEASIEISTNRKNWETVWHNGGYPATTDSCWLLVSYDISELADDQPEVYLRWVMGPSNDGWVYCGWNVDDVVLYGLEEKGTGGVLTSSTELDPPWPNPVRSGATLRYRIPSSGVVTLRVYDISGRLVARLEEGFRLQGEHQTSWDATGVSGERLPSGIYFVRADGCGSSDVEKAIILR